MVFFTGDEKDHILEKSIINPATKVMFIIQGRSGGGEVLLSAEIEPTTVSPVPRQTYQDVH